MLLIKSVPFESYDTLSSSSSSSSSSRSSILVIAGVAVVLYLSNFEASAEHESGKRRSAPIKNVRFLYLTVGTR